MDPGDPGVMDPVNSATKLGNAIIMALPPALLVVVLLNLAMMYMVLDTVKHASQQRLEILQSVIEKCLIH